MLKINKDIRTKKTSSIYSLKNANMRWSGLILRLVALTMGTHMHLHNWATFISVLDKVDLQDLCFNPPTSTEFSTLLRVLPLSYLFIFLSYLRPLSGFLMATLSMKAMLITVNWSWSLVSVKQKRRHWQHPRQEVVSRVISLCNTLCVQSLWLE